jgi:CheY-like chemotaxis protein/two-component sensor histidine kinase
MDRRKDQFLAMLAHELRNPLAPISNAVQILRLIGLDDPHRSEAWDLIDRQVQHLTRLVDDLLDVSRITQGKVVLQKERLDLAAVVSRAIEASRPLIDARHHELFVTLPSQAVRVEGDPVRLAQVFANLLNNAAKYTLDGGRLQLFVERTSDEALVRVRDNGVGISADLLPRVFELFTQGDRSLARSEGGLGIGLTMVKSLVEMHGGRVEARSEGLGRGSEFLVHLPILASKPVLAPTGSPGAAPALPSRRVLVVDDNQDAAQSLATLLRIRGQEVHVAFDGPSALQAAESFGPDIIFLDIGLPGMDGYEVAQHLRKQPQLDKMLLVALTGYGQQDDRRRSHEAGFDVHLVKPADPATLQRLIAEKQ